MNIVLRYAVAIFCLWISAFGAYAQDAKRGQYLATAAGCAGCHTEEKKDAVPFAGGRALKTPFGTFYGPNITPHPQSGIGGWSEADFMKALREGTRPDGAVREDVAIGCISVSVHAGRTGRGLPIRTTAPHITRRKE